jgi:filamentous hemagglutinin
LQQATNLISSNGQGTIEIGESTFTTLPKSGNAAIFSGATDAQVEQYFLNLTGQTQMPAARVIPGKGTLYVVNTPSGNFMLRDFSTSSGQTGPAWTIDIPKGAAGTTYNPEIKFLK